MPKPIEAENLSKLAGIRHGFFTRDGGVSEGIYAGLNSGLGSNDDPVTCAREPPPRGRASGRAPRRARDALSGARRNGIDRYRAARPHALPKADAIVSNTPGLAVGVLTADCTPVLFADPEAGVVAAAHAGWRGAVGGILEAAIAEMERQGARRSAIQAAIGPTISQKNYEVGPEFEAEVLNARPRK